MKQKTLNFLRSFLSLALAIVLCLGTALPALADLNGDGAAVGTESNPAKVGITKLLIMPDGTTIPTATFTFNVSKVSKNDETDSIALAAMPSIGKTDGTGTNSVTYATLDSSSVANGVKSVYQETPDILSGIIWPSAGVYVYEISEQIDSYTGTAQETMTYSAAKYRLSVYVKEKTSGSGFYVYGVSVVITTPDNGAQNGGDKVDPTPGTGGKHSDLIFTNSYLKTGGGGDPTDLANQRVSISKLVVGDYAEKDRYFTYDLTVTQPTAVTGNAATYKAYVLNSSNAIVTSASHTSTAIQTDSYGDYFTVTSGTQTSVMLKHGEKLVFTDVHIGASYVANEQGAVGYTPSAIVTVNGVTPENLSGSLGSSLSTNSRTIGDQGANTAAFTNTYRSDVTPTGIIIDNLPFILLLTVAVGTLVLFVVVKARKRRGYTAR